MNPSGGQPSAHRDFHHDFASGGHGVPTLQKSSGAARTRIPVAQTCHSREGGNPVREIYALQNSRQSHGLGPRLRGDDST
jgi:hypothetical protein